MNMKHDWLFLNVDESKTEATLDGSCPIARDGKIYEEKHYVVRYVVHGRTTVPNDLVIATENPQS